MIRQYSNLGKIILGFNLLIQLCFGCRNKITNIPLEESWWYSFDISPSSIDDCDFEIVYMELFFWKNKDDSLKGLIYSHNLMNTIWIEDIEKKSVNSYYLKGVDTINTRIFTIETDKQSILEVESIDKIFNWKNKFYLISKSDDGYWNFFGNREKWNKEMNCRQATHYRNFIIDRFKD